MEIKNRILENLQNLESKVESILNKPDLTIGPEYSDINKFKEDLSKKYSEKIQNM